MFVAVKDLPSELKQALKSVDYNKEGVYIKSTDKVSLIDAGCQGRRAFAVLVNLVTGEYKSTFGSWGGANAYNSDNIVGLDQNEYVIPLDCAVIKGSEGYMGTIASVILNPGNMPKWLPTKADLDKDELAVLDQFISLKSSYRNLRGKQDIVDNLVQRGLLKRNKVGAISITVEGKNNSSRKVQL